QEREEVLRTKETTTAQLEESLNAEIRDLEDRLSEKENLLKQQNGEISELSHKVESALGPLEEHKELAKGLTLKVSDLDQRLKEKEEALVRSNQEISNLKLATEAKATTADAQLQEREEALRAKESTMEQLEESLNAEIQDLEDRLIEKGSLLEASQNELEELRVKMASMGGESEDFVTLREEDVVTLDNVVEDKNGVTDASLLQGESTEELSNTKAEMEDLKKALREREIMLAAKETEVKMIKQSTQEKVRELEKTVQSQAKRQPGKSRLVSFLANIEKRH
ncbi:MAG: hypothetical protein V3S55_14755, partial [Nitrospiraceae bacterium]